MTDQALLEIRDLRVHFDTGNSVNRAVEGLSLMVGAGESVAIVGESGCGKSVTAMSILRLVPSPPARFDGTIRFKGRDMLTATEAEMRAVRGGEIGFIFQEPMTSLNPVFTVGAQIGEALRLHQGASRREALAKAVDLLTLVGIPSPQRRCNEFPHQLSGGMRQRVMIAMALACSPALLIADEPTTALDVTIQAQILELLRDLKGRTGAAILLITHDLGVVAEFAERVIVMYAGRKVEEASVGDLFNRPQHPYTLGLLGAVPRLGESLATDDPPRLNEIPGQVPDLRQPITGCVFAPRCSRARPVCSRVAPALSEPHDGHWVACHFAGEPSGPSAASNDRQLRAVQP